MKYFGSAALVSILSGISFANSAAAQSTLTQSFVGEDRSGQLFEADVCYHSRFHQMQLNQARFVFKTVMRFCNFSESFAEDAHFEAFFYNQEFKDTHLERSSFYLKSRSQVRFIRSHLDGAKFHGDVSGLTFEDSSLSGVTVNGRPCAEVLPACKEAEGPESSHQ